MEWLDQSRESSNSGAASATCDKITPVRIHGHGLTHSPQGILLRTCNFSLTCPPLFNMLDSIRNVYNLKCNGSEKGVWTEKKMLSDSFVNLSCPTYQHPVGLTLAPLDLKSKILAFLWPSEQSLILKPSTTGSRNFSRLSPNFLNLPTGPQTHLAHSPPPRHP